jgi:hypothetical protein
VIESVEVEATPEVVPDEASVAAGEVSLDGDEEDEDDEESDLASQQSSLVKKATPTNKAHTAATATGDTPTLGATAEGVEGEEQHVEENAGDNYLGGVEDQVHCPAADHLQQSSEELLSGEGEAGSGLNDPNQSQAESADVEAEQSLVSDQT